MQRRESIHRISPGAYSGNLPWVEDRILLKNQQDIEEAKIRALMEDDSDVKK